jgi:hypothetical protein
MSFKTITTSEFSFFNFQAVQVDNALMKTNVQVLITFPGDDLAPKFSYSEYTGSLKQV